MATAASSSPSMTAARSFGAGVGPVTGAARAIGLTSAGVGRVVAEVM